MKRALIPASLLLLAGCQEPKPQTPRPYAAAEEGLTLVYINPSLPKDQQDAKRLQVRVDKVVERSDGALAVFKTFTVGLEKPVQAILILKDGGLGLLSPDGKNEAPMLPAGFPDATGSWSLGSAAYRVLGRGAWVRGEGVLPDDRRSDGVWVEMHAGAKTARTLYLPGIGEVQTDELRPDGSWTTVNLLTQYGFSDIPSAPPMQGVEEPPPQKPAKRAKKR